MEYMQENCLNLNQLRNTAKKCLLNVGNRGVQEGARNGDGGLGKRGRENKDDEENWDGKKRFKLYK